MYDKDGVDATIELSRLNRERKLDQFYYGDSNNKPDLFTLEFSQSEAGDLKVLLSKENKFFGKKFLEMTMEDLYQLKNLLNKVIF